MAHFQDIYVIESDIKAELKRLGVSLEKEAANRGYHVVFNFGDLYTRQDYLNGVNRGTRQLIEEAKFYGHSSWPA